MTELASNLCFPWSLERAIQLLARRFLARRRREQLARPQQIVSCRREMSGHLFLRLNDEAVLALAIHSLRPAEDYLYGFAFALSQWVPLMTGGARSGSKAVPSSNPRDVRGDASLAQPSHEGFAVIGLIGSERGPLAGHAHYVLKEPTCHIALDQLLPQPRKVQLIQPLRSHAHVPEATNHQNVVKPLAERPIRTQRVKHNQQLALEQPLPRHRGVRPCASTTRPDHPRCVPAPLRCTALRHTADDPEVHDSPVRSSRADVFKNQSCCACGYFAGSVTL